MKYGWLNFIIKRKEITHFTVNNLEFNISNYLDLPGLFPILLLGVLEVRELPVSLTVEADSTSTTWSESAMISLIVFLEEALQPMTCKSNQYFFVLGAQTVRFNAFDPI